MSTASLNITLNFQQIVDAIKQLGPTEKAKINELMWSDDMNIPKEHQDIVLNRMKKSKNNPERMLDWDEVSKEF